MTDIKTYDEMNGKICGLLRFNGDNISLYAAQRIKELEAENSKIKSEFIVAGKTIADGREVVSSGINVIEILEAEIKDLRAQLRNSIVLPYPYNTFGGRRQLVYGKYYILKKTPHGSLTVESFSTEEKQLKRLKVLRRKEEK